MHMGGSRAFWHGWLCISIGSELELGIMILHECFVRCIFHLNFRGTRFRQQELIASEARVFLDMQPVAVGNNSSQSQQNVLQS